MVSIAMTLFPGVNFLEKKERNLYEVPMLPLRGVLVFPYMIVHLDVGREKSINAIDQAMLDKREIFLAMQKEAQTDEPDENDIYQVGTVRKSDSFWVAGYHSGAGGGLQAKIENIFPMTHILKWLCQRQRIRLKGDPRLKP